MTCLHLGWNHRDIWWDSVLRRNGTHVSIFAHHYFEKATQYCTVVEIYKNIPSVNFPLWICTFWGKYFKKSFELEWLVNIFRQLNFPHLHLTSFHLRFLVPATTSTTHNLTGNPCWQCLPKRSEMCELRFLLRVDKLCLSSFSLPFLQTTISFEFC